MPLLQINATATGALEDPAALAAAAGRIAAGRGPIVIMVHGYRFAPGRGQDCPHRHILSLTPSVRDPRAVSWPRGLGLAEGQPPRAIAFGWPGMGRVRRVWDNAAQAGRALAGLIAALRRIAPHRPVQALAHSMGARVVFCAMQASAAPGLGRVLLLNAAAYQSQARAALCQAADSGTEVINITSGENAIFDLMLETLVPAPCPGDRSLGAGLPAAPGLVTLRLDDARHLSALAQLGHAIGPPDRRVCHWSPYLRPGAFDLYRALLWSPDRLPLEILRSKLPQDQPPRWSHLLQIPRPRPSVARPTSARPTSARPTPAAAGFFLLQISAPQASARTARQDA